MLRILLVTAPTSEEQAAALAEHLRQPPLSEVYAPPSLAAVATAIARPHAIEPGIDTAFDRPEGALDRVQRLAAEYEGTVALVASEEVARAVVGHALDAPVPAERLVFDSGGYAEVEARADAPWTVNRLNERCYERDGGLQGIVRT